MMLWHLWFSCLNFDKMDSLKTTFRGKLDSRTMIYLESIFCNPNRDFHIESIKDGFNIGESSSGDIWFKAKQYRPHIYEYVLIDSKAIGSILVSLEYQNKSVYRIKKAINLTTFADMTNVLEHIITGKKDAWYIKPYDTTTTFDTSTIMSAEEHSEFLKLNDTPTPIDIQTITISNGNIEMLLTNGTTLDNDLLAEIVEKCRLAEKIAPTSHQMGA